MKVTVSYKQFINSQPPGEPLGKWRIFFGTVYYVKEYENDAIHGDVTFLLLTPEQYVQEVLDRQVVEIKGRVMTVNELNGEEKS